MNENDEYSYSNRDLYRGMIRYALYKYGKLTAKELQKYTGIKRQTVYNYLSELTREGLLKAEHLSLSDKPNRTIAYYSINYSSVAFPKELDDVPIADKPRKMMLSFEETRARINRVIDSNMAALVEFKTILNNLTEEEWIEKYWSDPEVDGLMHHIILLSEDRFKDYQREMKKVMNKLWLENKNKPGDHTRDIFFIGFIKHIDR
ncbi:MAG: helix-turn-helix domain-containing protein [Candidatus Odinarchaeota archaeon]